MYHTAESPFEIVERALNSFYCNTMSQHKLLRIVEKQYLRASKWLRQLKKVGESGFPTLTSFVRRFQDGHKFLMQGIKKVYLALCHEDYEALGEARSLLHRGHALVMG